MTSKKFCPEFPCECMCQGCKCKHDNSKKDKNKSNDVVNALKKKYE